jgi:hypothetical protein
MVAGVTDVSTTVSRSIDLIPNGVLHDVRKNLLIQPASELIDWLRDASPRRSVLTCLVLKGSVSWRFAVMFRLPWVPIYHPRFRKRQINQTNQAAHFVIILNANEAQPYRDLTDSRLPESIAAKPGISAWACRCLPIAPYARTL